LTGPGSGAAVFARRGARTILRAARASSPLHLLTPRNHGHGAWITAATFGGGLVDGDALRLDLDLEVGAAGLVGTQASTKVYRCPRGACRQDVRARVADGAILVIVPDPVACFAGARYEQSSAVDLAPTGSLVLLDTFTAGRSGRGERWDFQRCAARTAITRAGALVLHDALVLDPAQGDLRARMGRFDAIATLVLAGPRTASMRDAALAAQSPIRRAAPLVEAASPVGDDAAVVRIAGTTVEAVTAAARARLAGLADLLGDDPFARKW
jgi:urease accessory protein